MSPHVLRLLLLFRNGQAVLPAKSSVLIYGINPLERNVLKWYVELRRWERMYP